jgi:large subunit ribosomal protein L23e
VPIAAGRGGAVGNKFRMGVGMPVAGVMNCADNSGAQPSTPLRQLFSLFSRGFRGKGGNAPPPAMPATHSVAIAPPARSRAGGT